LYIIKILLEQSVVEVVVVVLFVFALWFVVQK
jgi:hypothetical protein